MKKRWMTGLLAGGLMVGMLPGVASAAGNGPPVANAGQCVKAGVLDRAADPSVGRGPVTALGTFSDLIIKGPLNRGQNPFTFETGCGPIPPA